MIPTIEDIVVGLLAGTITKEQAVAWLYKHKELSAEQSAEAAAALLDVREGEMDKEFEKWWEKEGAVRVGHTFSAYGITKDAWQAAMKRRRKCAGSMPRTERGLSMEGRP